MKSFKDFFNQNKIEYRNITNDDIDAVIRICQNEPEFNNIESQNNIKSYLLDSVNFKKSIIAINKNTIIGCILISPEEKYNDKIIREIIILWVDKDFRKRGIGEKLVRDIESSSRNIGTDSIIVQVYKQLKTHDFWKKRGYKLYNITSEAGNEVFMYRKKL